MNRMAHHGLKLTKFNCLAISLLLLSLFASCQNISNSKLSNSKTICTDSTRFVTLIAATLDLPNLQQYFKVQETLNQKELVILKNRNLKYVGILCKFNNPVKFMNEVEIKENNIKAYLEYEEINIKQDTAYVYYRYDVQGIGIKSTYNLKECKWVLITSHLWEN